MTAFCRPDRLFEWLVMPQGSGASPGWFVTVINEVIKGLECISAYLDDTIVFDPDPTDHVANIRALFGRLVSTTSTFSLQGQYRRHIPPTSWGTLSAGGYSPNSDKVAALIKMPMPTDKKEVRSLLGGINYYGKFLLNL